MSTKTPENQFDLHAASLRREIKELAKEVAGSLRDTAVQTQEVFEPAELQANITLAYRHLEDAAMRLGKAIQARDGGKSVYDK